MADSLTNEAKYLSGRVYHNSKYTKNLGYQTLGKQEDIGNGFYAEAYYKNGKIIIAYRGTDDYRVALKEAIKDGPNDLIMGIIKLQPSQAINARKYYDYIARKYRNYPIYTTGHSLGGSLAQIVASEVKEAKAITFNAYGTGNLRGVNPKYPENVTNYGNAKDIVFTQNMNNHIGKTLVVGEVGSTDRHLQKYHSIENMGDIETAVAYTPKKPGKNTSVLANAKQLTQNNKIQKVHEMFQKHEEKLKNKKSSGAKRSTSSGGNGRWVTMNGRHVYLAG